MPAARARSRPFTPGWLEITVSMRAEREPSATRSIRFCKLRPLPEIRTPSRMEPFIRDRRLTMDLPLNLSHDRGGCHETRDGDPARGPRRLRGLPQIPGA